MKSYGTDVNSINRTKKFKVIKRILTSSTDFASANIISSAPAFEFVLSLFLYEFFSIDLAGSKRKNYQTKCFRTSKHANHSNKFEIHQMIFRMFVRSFVKNESEMNSVLIRDSIQIPECKNVPSRNRGSRL